MYLARRLRVLFLLRLQRSNVEKLLKTSNKGSQIMLDVDGQSYDVLIKEIQFNPSKGTGG